MKKIILSIFTIIILIIGFEVILRGFPRIMPFSDKWNYIHHYADLSRLLRGLPTHNTTKPQIISIGDSYTRGAEISPGKDWVSILNNKFEKKIFNLAVGGSSNVEQWVLLKEFVIPNSVEHVLLIINRNDIDQNFSDLVLHKDKGDRPFIQRVRKTVLIEPKPNGWKEYDRCRIDGWFTYENCWYYRSYFVATLVNVFRQFTLKEVYTKKIEGKDLDLIFDSISKRYISKNLKLSDLKNQETWLKDNSEEIGAMMIIIKKIKNHLSKKKITLSVAYIPFAEEIYYSDWASKLGINITSYTSAATVLKFMFLELDIPFKDLTTSLQKIRLSFPPIFLPIDGHYSERGHRMIAENINKFLIDNNKKN